MFTNWGRIARYDPGQYQNTPFCSADKAVEEFEKIFKSKTGNEWKDGLDHYVNKPKKYRLVKTNYLQHVKKSALKFDLKSKVTRDLTDFV